MPVHTLLFFPSSWQPCPLGWRYGYRNQLHLPCLDCDNNYQLAQKPEYCWGILSFGYHISEKLQLVCSSLQLPSETQRNIIQNINERHSYMRVHDKNLIKISFLPGLLPLHNDHQHQMGALRIRRLLLQILFCRYSQK